MDATMQKIMLTIPNADHSEMIQLQSMCKEMSDDATQQLLLIYKEKRRDHQTILILTLIGLFGVAGIQRFYVNQIGMGVLYFLTGGLCVIGTIMDLINNKTLAKEYNHQMMFESLNMVKLMQAS